MSWVELSSSSRIAVVIVNWNGRAYTLECLRSLQEQQHTELEVVLVDNGSIDGSVCAVRGQFPDTVIIRAGSNLGYAGGNNLGLGYALDRGFEYVLVLNNDTVLAADCAYQLVMDLERHPDAAAAAPKSYYLDLPDIIYFAGGKIRRNGQTIHIGGNCSDGLEYGRAIDTEWINGCAILFRGSALREIGLFEPRFFLLFEETDWCLRARRAGYRLRFVPDARLWHKVSPSFDTAESPLFLYYHTRNQFFWIERNFPLPQKLALFAFALMRTGSNAFLRTKNLGLEIRRRQRKAIWRGLTDYVWRRFGPQMDITRLQSS
jgi:GT2 family glycosyltransferase